MHVLEENSLPLRAMAVSRVRQSCLMLAYVASMADEMQLECLLIPSNVSIVSTTHAIEM
jgi:hypothetical protein